MNPFRKICTVCLLAAVVAFAAPNALADYAVLRNGETLHIAGYLREGSKILLYVPGGSVVVAAADVTRFEPEDAFTSIPVALNAPFAAQIRTAAAKNGLDAKLISSVISAESNFNPHAISPAHAMGLMQLMPATTTQFAVRNPFDPAQNISAGARYLKQLLDKYRGSLSLALAAYNAGPQRVAQYGGVPPFAETHRYIRLVTDKLKEPGLLSPALLPQ
ncbi:MAG TPA: lytic transglycosylase domain-containing protein [Candidatus Acidoferrales bacterium]|nr:lytic transglycosylase domain-containing protein [Candidatus Acidoferrales bacterium]